MQKQISVISDSDHISEEESEEIGTPVHVNVTRATFGDQIRKGTTSNSSSGLMRSDSARNRRSTRMHLKVKGNGTVDSKENQGPVKPGSRFFKEDGRMYRTITKEFNYFGTSYVYDED